MAGEGSELDGMEETMSELGFVGSDDDDNKVVWEDLEGDALHFSSGAGGRAGSSSRRGILVTPALQITCLEKASTREHANMKIDILMVVNDLVAPIMVLYLVTPVKATPTTSLSQVASQLIIATLPSLVVQVPIPLRW